MTCVEIPIVLALMLVAAGLVLMLFCVARIMVCKPCEKCETCGKSHAEVLADAG